MRWGVYVIICLISASISSVSLDADVHLQICHCALDGAMHSDGGFHSTS